MVNKKGWIKVAESFLAIILLMGIVFTVVGQFKINENKKSYIEEKQVEILVGIEGNDTFRNEVISATNFEIDSRNETFSALLKYYLGNNSILNFPCYLKICQINTSCELNLNSNGEIYASEVIVSNSQGKYSPRKLKIFCLK